MMKKVSVLLFLMSLSAFAANHAVRSTCTSFNGDGSSFVCATSSGGVGPFNSLSSISYVRGDKYVLWTGTYCLSSGCVFSTADSGTTPITIEAATATNEATLLPGYTSAAIAPSTFGPLNFTTDYWTWNGEYRGSGTGIPGTDWRTGYGFRVVNRTTPCTHTTSCVPVNTTAAVIMGNPGTSPVSGIIFEYTEVEGSGDITGAYTDAGIYSSWSQSPSNQTTGNIVQDDWVHDVGAASMIDCDSCATYSVISNWVENNEVTPNNHSEPISIRCWGTPTPGNNSNITIAYNVVLNSNATASIATPCGPGNIAPSNWAIYGNFFGLNASYFNQSYVCTTGATGNQTECGNGDGWLSLWNFSTWTGYLYVFNNTVASIDQFGALGPGYGQQGSCGHDWGGGTPTSMGTVLFENNLYVGCTSSINQPSCPATGSNCTQYVDDWNSYINMGTVVDPGAHKQVSSGSSPFVNFGQTAGQLNFALAGASDPTSAGNNTNAILPANGTDMLGNTRNTGAWSRGALQFEAGGTATQPVCTSSNSSMGGIEMECNSANSSGATAIMCVTEDGSTPSSNGSTTTGSTIPSCNGSAFALAPVASGQSQYPGYFAIIVPGITVKVIAGVAGETDSSVATYTPTVATQTVLATHFGAQCGTGQTKNCGPLNTGSPDDSINYPTSAAFPPTNGGIFRWHDSGFAWPQVETQLFVATFTNGSALIQNNLLNQFTAGTAVQFTTTGTLPTNFSAGTNYYVLATSLTSGQFEVSTSPGGSPVLAGSAGTGVQNVVVWNWTSVDAYLDAAAAHPSAFPMVQLTMYPCSAAGIAYNNTAASPTGCQGANGNGTLPNYGNNTGVLPTDIGTGTGTCLGGSPSFCTYVSTLVNHVSGNGNAFATTVKAIQLTNEVNLCVHNRGTFPQLYQMLQPAAQIIRAAMPGVVLGGPSMSPASGANINCGPNGSGGGTTVAVEDLTSWLNQESSSGIISDFSDYHVYFLLTNTTVNTPEAQYTAVSNAFSTAIAALAGWKNAPWADTETSYSSSTSLASGSYTCPSTIGTPVPPTTYSQVDCAAFPVRWQILEDSTFVGSNLSGAISSDWYYWNWGFVTNGIPASYATAYKVAQQYLTGGHFTAAASSTGSPAVWTAPFVEANGTVAIWAWTPSEAGATYTLPAGYNSYRDLTGSRTVLAPGATTIAVTVSPVMLEKSTIIPNPATGLFATVSELMSEILQGGI